MLAIEVKASIFCARDMRGTLSMASTVILRAASARMSSGFCAGQMKLMRVVPGFMRLTSSRLGARTLNSMSHDCHSSAAFAAMRAPAAR